MQISFQIIRQNDKHGNVLSCKSLLLFMCVEIRINHNRAVNLHRITDSIQILIKFIWNSIAEQWTLSLINTEYFNNSRKKYIYSE